MRGKKRSHWFWRLLKVTLLLVLIAALLVGALAVYLQPACTREEGVVYGRRGSVDLTLDVVTPTAPNGRGILMLMSGSWKSKKGSFKRFLAAPLLRQGFTVFAVYHVSQPEVTIMQIVEDMHRAVRFVRTQAEAYGVDPDHLGVTGASSGGHLSLMLATGAGVGPLDPLDAVDQASSAVQAVGIFFPVTDLLNLGTSTENPGDGGPPIHYVKGFGPEAQDAEAWQRIGREVSPIYHVTADLPPVRVVHGDADTLTPLEQSLWFQNRCQAVGRSIELIVQPGKKHGWLTMIWDIRSMAAWFSTTLGAAG